MALNPITALIASGALVLASSIAAPVQAGDKEDALLTFLLGAGALAIIANNRQDKHRTPTSDYRRDRHHSSDYHNHYQERIWKGDRAHRRAAIRKRMTHGHEVPRTCLRKRWTEDGWKTFTNKKCLKRHKAKHHFHTRKKTGHFHTHDGRIIRPHFAQGHGHGHHDGHSH